MKRILSAWKLKWRDDPVMPPVPGPDAQPVKPKEVDSMPVNRSESPPSTESPAMIAEDDVAETTVRALAAIATNAWKARQKMVDSGGEVREEMKRVFRHLENILESLQALGIEIKDHTGDTFDYGLPLNVVTTQPTPGITRECVTETIKPTVYWQNQIIQMGEVIIATPAPPSTDL